MDVFVILLRGVTPSGKNKVLMAPLRAALTKAGLKGVQTYIQSGNVIAKSHLNPPALEKLVHEAICNSSGGNISVLAKTPDQLSDILKSNPYKDADVPQPYFSLLATEPDEQFLTEFLSTDFLPDRVHYLNNTIYTLYATKHSDSKFNNNYFERKLRVTATTRNINTMTKLATLAAAQQFVGGNSEQPTALQ
jgi:uncharacterized protein (DUF1697 family)